MNAYRILSDYFFSDHSKILENISKITKPCSGRLLKTIEGLTRFKN